MIRVEPSRAISTITEKAKTQVSFVRVPRESTKLAHEDQLVSSRIDFHKEDKALLDYKIGREEGVDPSHSRMLCRVAVSARPRQRRR